MPKSSSPASYVSRRRWTVVDARAALSALAASGLSPSAFAAREKLDVQRLHSWRRKIAASDRKSARSSFVELRPRAAERVEIVLRSGLTLRVAESIDAAALLRLVEALERSSPPPASC